jgi:hypothetical protein
MKIQALCTFLDGPDRFEKDDQRTVSDEDGARFVANGWARDMAGQVATGGTVSGVTNLAVDGAVIGTGDSNG